MDSGMVVFKKRALVNLAVLQPPVKWRRAVASLCPTGSVLVRPVRDYQPSGKSPTRSIRS